MKDQGSIRNGVIESLPEARQIKNEELKEQVYDAWAMALSASGFEKIDDIAPSGNPGTPRMKSGSQADHLRSVTRLSLAIAQELKNTFPQFQVDMDEVIAGGLCHDLGKPFEFDPENQKRWKNDPRIAGRPSLRHPVYGAHIALSAGLPENIAHIAGCHSPEGDNVERSLVCQIVHLADYAFWGILGKAGILSSNTAD
jgi:putative nucleotidyltransferase with HDIG domain